MDTLRIVDFITRPESVAMMIAMSKLGLPAISGIVSELEKQFGDCKIFPLSTKAGDVGKLCRQNVGRIIKFVMKAYGYTPVKKTGDKIDRVRIKQFLGSKYFTTATIYTRTIPNPQYTIEIYSRQNY